jgi:hypothetical protein
MSRAFGNHLLKRFVVADPEIQVPLCSHKLCILSIARVVDTTLECAILCHLCT